MIKSILLFFITLFSLHAISWAQVYKPNDYCLTWSDEFDVDGAPNTTNWRYETGYSIRNNEAQNYTNNRRENARIENGFLILEARRDNYQGYEYSSASLVSWSKVVHQYGRFEIRAKIDTRLGSWPAFWTLGESGEWPSNGEIDIMEYYQSKILGNAAWGTETRWTAEWNSKSIPFSSFSDGWQNEFHIFMMEWDYDYIRLYVDNILINEINLNNTFNGSLGDYKNPFRQPHYLLLNQSIRGVNGGDPSGTQFPIQYIIDYVRIYQKGNCNNLDCNWDVNGTAYQDDCLSCVGGNTGRQPCTLECNGNLIQNDNLETGDLSSWTGWGTRQVSTQDAFTGIYSVAVGNGSAEQLIDVQANTTYVLKTKARKSGGGWLRLGVKDHGKPESYSASDRNVWVDLEHEFATGNSTTALIYFYNPDGGTAYGDDFELLQKGCDVVLSTTNITKNNFRLYPNPADESSWLEVEKPAHIEVYTKEGILKKQFQLNAKTSFGAGLESGYYILKITTSDGMYSLPWVKQ